MATFGGPLHKSSNSLSFGGPVQDLGTGSANAIPKAQRARHVVGDFAAGEVALYDAAGNPLLIADDAAFTPGTSPVVPIGALADETLSDSVDEGDIGAPRMTLQRILRVVPSTDAGVSLQVDDTDKPAASLYGKSVAAGDTPVLVDASGRLLSRVVNAAGTDLRAGPAVDVATIADVLNALGIGQYNSTPPIITTGQYNHLQVGARGSLRTELRSADGNTGATVVASGDGVANQNGLAVVGQGQAFNGTAWDRLRTSPVGPGAINNAGVLLTNLALTDGSNIANVYGNSPGSDGLAPANIARAIGAHGLGYAFNGTGWDRVRSGLFDDAVDIGALRTTIGLRNSAGRIDPMRSIQDVLDGAQRYYTATGGLGFNGATWDRWRNNTEGTALASAARTATTLSALLTNHNARGVLLHFEISAVPGGDTVTLVVKSRDPVTGGIRTHATDAAVSAVSSRQILVYPGASGATDIETIRGVPIPRTWYVEIIHSGVGSFTYSVGYSLIL